MAEAKFPAVLNDLRRRISEGDLPSGSKMPTWDVLSQHYAIGRPTLMRVMATLRHEGFVISDATRGTMVTPKPPCCSRFGLIFGSSPDRRAFGGWNHFWQALRDEATAQSARDGWDLVVYEGVDHRGSAGLDALLADVDGRRLAGVILTPHGTLYHIDEHLRGRVPMVQVGGRLDADFLGREVPAWQLDNEDLYRRSAHLLHQAGARRVAILATDATDVSGWDEALLEAGLSGEPWWRFAAGITAQRTTANLVRLLCSAANRPDGLIITDDNLVPGAVAGLLESGVRVGKDLHVAAQCNWPFPADDVLPIMHIGFDLGHMLSEALAYLRSPSMPPDSALAGRRMPAVTANEFIAHSPRSKKLRRLLS